MSISENLNLIKSELGEDVSLVAVSKTKPNELILEAYKAGQRIFGENKAQEMQSKAEALPKDIEWHFIGHLQRNKVKYIVPHVSLIHSVDSMRLLQEINKRAASNGRVINVLLQVYIAKEESKFGLDEEELNDLLNSDELKASQNIKVLGLMAMATNTDDKETVRREFNYLKNLYEQLKDQHQLQILSMGMSNDYEIAVECGSNMVRIGSRIFGARN